MIVKECINERKYSQKNNNEFEKDLPDSDFEGCMHTKGRDGICHICVGKKKKKKENDKKSLPNFVKKPNPEEEEKEEEEDSDFEGCRHTKGRDGICHICARTKKKKIENNKKSLPKFVKKPYEEKEEEEDSDYEGCRHTKGWDGICHICEGKKKKNNKEILPKILKKPYKDEEEQPPKNQREKIQNDENDDLDLNLIKKLDIDNYIQLEILGKGEFGSVYKIYDKVLKKYIAFKILRIDLFQYTYKDYLCEGVILQNLYQSNPEYFVEYYNTFKNKDENTPSLMLSIQAGIAALSDIMQYRKRYNDSEIIYIILELSTSLALAQEAGFSHGDIKLADVVLFKEKEKLRYKLIDFGLAHRMKKNNIKNTTENEEELYEYRIKGITENYAAPELMKVFSDKFEAKKLINIYKLDIYALGILGLHLMGLKFIFIKEIKQNIDSIEKYKTEYPSSIDFIKKMINLDPKKRINYSELILILKKKEATYPNENFWLERYQENQLKTLTELDLEKYVKLHLEINDIKSARHFCYAWLDKARKNQENKKRMVFCLTKCAELDFSLEYYELGIEHYDEAIALLKNSNEQADVELFQTITKKKQAILIEKEQKKN